MAAPRRTKQARLEFEAIAVEGGLLLPEWLTKVARLEAPAQAPVDYRVPRGLTMRDEVARFWRIAKGHRSEFVAARDSAADRQALSEQFVKALLRDCFQFASLGAVPPVIVDDRDFPIGHAALAGRVPVVIAPAGHRLDTPLPATEGRRRTAHGLCQEYLNAVPEALWGIASDGERLRILRDNASLTRPAWIEADLARLFDEDRYADFAALWLLVHETRFGRADRPMNECPLEVWRGQALAAGVTAREQLRDGVEKALEDLGQGFWEASPDLRTRLRDDPLAMRAFFGELLRLVYRLIFLLTAEERDLLHGHASPATRRLYEDGYGLRRLRERAVRRLAHDHHHDLWEATKVVFRGVASGQERLGLPALGGLFAVDQCPTLDGCRLQNRHLLRAVFHLAWLRQDSGLVRVNWRDMGPEELGSVYESLLELHPRIADEYDTSPDLQRPTVPGRRFRFVGGLEAAGNARKKTGSYYTPDSLVQVLLEQALEPVMADAERRHPQGPVAGLLELSIVDPACGSGHFLLAAARRLADRIARRRANGTPTPAEYRHAVREVIGRCIYGVDLEPLAVELCKVSLWMEAIEPGLPLSFLDAHVQLGNALLGTTPELMGKGLPDAAWDPIEGDDRAVARALKRRNKEEAIGQLFFTAVPAVEAKTITTQLAALESAPDTDLPAVIAKEQTWEQILGSAEYRQQKRAADAWCAAFVWPKDLGSLRDAAPTVAAWRALAAGKPVDAKTLEITAALAARYAFFHWHLQFPLVFARGGFDVVLGNPPWERVKLQEIEFFAARSDEIAEAPNAAARKRLIAELRSEQPAETRKARLALWYEWMDESRKAEGWSHFVRQSGRYPLCGKGDVNTYALFAEHNRHVVRPKGAVGCILPAGIATDDTTKDYFQDLVASKTLLAILHFENEDRLFPTVNNMFRYVLLAAGGVERTRPAASVVAFARQANDVLDPTRQYTLSEDEIRALNPNTKTFPTFRTRRDADINLAIYRRVGVLWREGDPDGNPWGLRFMAMFHMANDSGLFRMRAELEGAGWRLDGNHFVMDGRRMLPLLEAKMVHHFDHRFATYEGATEANRNKGTLPQATNEQHANPAFVAMPEYWVEEKEVEAKLENRWQHGWLLGWRDITNAKNARTVIASLVPRVATADTLLVALPSVDARMVACLATVLSSFVLDYCARQKVGGTHLKYHTLKQLAVLRPAAFQRKAPWQKEVQVHDWVLTRATELVFSAKDMASFASEVGHSRQTFVWDPNRRFQLRCELDAALFHLYGIERDDVAYILDTFPVVQKNERDLGEYRTKRVILEVYDALAEATRSGKPYVSPLESRETAS